MAIRSDRVSLADEPLTDILAVAGNDPNRTPEAVILLDRDVNPPAAELPDQCALHALPMREPVSVLVFRHLVELGCINTGDPHFLP